MSDVKPVAKNTFTIEEMQVELDAAHFAQEHCRSLWGASRGHSDWRKTHDGFIAGYKAKNAALQAEIESMRKDAERHESALEKLRQWAQAYPLEVFPEPDFKKAHEVLKANGMTLDAISAFNMRHVITKVVEIVDAAIAKEKQQESLK